MTYKPGLHLFVCDVCGFELTSDKKRKRWDNLIVCPEDWEPDHPQKYIRVQPDGLPVSDPRPEPEDEFVFVCDLWSSSPMADFGEADCASVGGNTNIEFLIQLFNPRCVAEYAIAGRSIPGVM